MEGNDSPQEPDKMTKDRSTLVEILKLVVPAFSAIVVAYLSYLQITEPKSIEIAATQTAMIASQAALSLVAASTEMPTEMPTAPVATAPPVTPTTVATLQSSPTPAAAATSLPRVSPTSVLVTSATSGPTPDSTSSTTEMMVTIISLEEGAPVISVLPETLRFQGHKVIGLRSGEYVPFTNIQLIDVEEVRGGVVSISITFTDGTTMAATVEKDTDLLEGETLNGIFQNYMFALKQVRLPNEGSPVADSQPMITVTTPEGEMAQVIASTLLFQQEKVLLLVSGERIPFAQIMTIDVGEVSVTTVPLEITFTDNSTLAATVEKDSDIVDGETLHGFFQRNLYALKQVEFPNEGQSPSSSTSLPLPMITVTTQEGAVAQIIANTLLFQQENVLALNTGELIPFVKMQRIDIEEVRGNVVSIAITFTDGTSLATTLEKDSDILEGETLHGTFQKNMYALKQIEFPNEW